MRAITVYCSSSEDLDPVYHETARIVGAEIARRRLTLVFGGGSVGLMGIMAREARAGSARVVGIITRALMDHEVVDTMSERKRQLLSRGDAILVLPGGIGTYEEFFEALVARKLGEHDKPIGVVNAHGYFDPLLAMLDHGVEERFIGAGAMALFHVDSDAASVLDTVVSEASPATSP